MALGDKRPTIPQIRVRETGLDVHATSYGDLQDTRVERLHLSVGAFDSSSKLYPYNARCARSRTQWRIHGDEHVPLFRTRYQYQNGLEVGSSGSGTSVTCGALVFGMISHGIIKR